MSPVVFDKLQSDLNLEKTENIEKSSRIAQLEQELERAVASLKDFHERMVKLDTYTKLETSNLQEMIDDKIKE